MPIAKVENNRANIVSSNGPEYAEIRLYSRKIATAPMIPYVIFEFIIL